MWKHDRQLPLWYPLGLYEPHVAGIISALLDPGEVFWDIGANAGYHTLVGALRVGAEGKVVALEPDADLCRRASEQLQLNGLSNYVLEPLAVAGRGGQVSLIRDPTDPMRNALSGLAAEGQAVPVPAITLDSMASRCPWPRLVKMDIEGAEVEALEAAGALLRGARQPYWVIAVHGRESLAACRQVFQKSGYAVRRLGAVRPILVAAPTERVPVRAGDGP